MCFRKYLKNPIQDNSFKTSCSSSSNSSNLFKVCPFPPSPFGNTPAATRRPHPQEARGPRRVAEDGAVGAQQPLEDVGDVLEVSVDVTFDLHVSQDKTYVRGSDQLTPSS
jgi:hypothetical protein